VGASSRNVAKGLPESGGWPVASQGLFVGLMTEDVGSRRNRERLICVASEPVLRSHKEDSVQLI
jgi:hypothetical protein